MSNCRSGLVDRFSTKTSISIHELCLKTTLGVHEKERLVQREVVVDIRFDIAESCSGLVDRLESAVDYSTIRDKLAKVAEISQAYLLEHLAEKMLEAVIEDARILGVALRVKKPDALKGVSSVSVTKSWSRCVGPALAEASNLSDSGF
jgi:D-erythro-7,8-dihydroneopterin triphosphate epimerase